MYVLSLPAFKAPPRVNVDVGVAKEDERARKAMNMRRLQKTISQKIFVEKENFFGRPVYSLLYFSFEPIFTRLHT